MSGNEIRNRLISELSEATGENAAKCSEAIRGYYDLRLKFLKESPSLVAAFDAEELERAQERANAAQHGSGTYIGSGLWGKGS